jgi:hypothetical protein
VNDPRRLTTDERRERFAVAHERGGLCAACGRSLDEGEPVYVGPLVIDIARPVGERVGGYRATMVAPVGVECASPALLAQAEGREPGQCAGCSRPVYYAANRPGRHVASCSRYCRNRAAAATARRDRLRGTGQ